MVTCIYHICLFACADEFYDGSRSPVVGIVLPGVNRPTSGSGRSAGNSFVSPDDMSVEAPTCSSLVVIFHQLGESTEIHEIPAENAILLWMQQQQTMSTSFD